MRSSNRLSWVLAIVGILFVIVFTAMNLLAANFLTPS